MTWEKHTTNERRKQILSCPFSAAFSPVHFQWLDFNPTDSYFFYFFSLSQEINPKVIINGIIDSSKNHTRENPDPYKFYNFKWRCGVSICGPRSFCCCSL
jgi:hypothetical protein